MIGKNLIQVSEVVGIGHPDKMADVIADTIVDSLLEFYSHSRAAIEVLCTGKNIILGGEYYCGKEEPSSTLFIDATKKALRAIYDDKDINSFNIFPYLQKQSKEIRKACSSKEHSQNRFCRIADTGVAYGYADNTNKRCLPLSHFYACEIRSHLWSKRKETSNVLKHDYKIQVETLGSYLRKVTISCQYCEGQEVGFVREYLKNLISRYLENMNAKRSSDFELVVNPGEGTFTVGSFDADTGVTNRKLMCDNYGTNVEHGGGGYSGKDFTKPDRLFGVYARYIALNVVKAGVCSWCKVRIVYTYGKNDIDRIDITGASLDSTDIEIIRRMFPTDFLTIFEKLKCDKFLSSLAHFGHFGGGDFYPWENCDMAEKIAKEFKQHGDVY